MDVLKGVNIILVMLKLYDIVLLLLAGKENITLNTTQRLLDL